MGRIETEFGALAPKLATQLVRQKQPFDSEKLEHVQRDADALTRVRIRGYLNERVVETAQRRLMKRIMDCLGKPRPAGEEP